MAREPKTIEEVFGEVEYVVYLFEPSTNWWSLRSIAHGMREAQHLAKGMVDEACKTEGWIYKKLGGKFYPMGYAYWRGDGEVAGKELISDHVFFQDEPLSADGDVILPGWGFWDETGGCGGCGFPTIEAAHEALKKYAETL